MRRWIKTKWLKFRKWFYGVLVSFGIFAAAVVQAKDIVYNRATEYEDGSPLPIEEIAETRLYCNDQLLLTEPGADGAFDNAFASLPAGDNICYATHVATNGMESAPSVSRLFRVTPMVPPLPPVLQGGQTVPP